MRLLVETVGEGEADPAGHGRVRGGTPDGLLRGLVQDVGSGGAKDLHGLDRAVRRNPEAEVHRPLEPVATRRFGIRLGLLDLAPDDVQESSQRGSSTGTHSPTTRGHAGSCASFRGTASATRDSLAKPGVSGPATSAAASMIGGPAPRPTRSAPAPLLQEQDALGSPLCWQRWRSWLGFIRGPGSSLLRKGMSNRSLTGKAIRLRLRWPATESRDGLH